MARLTFAAFALISLFASQTSAVPLNANGYASRWPVCQNSGGQPLETIFDQERSVLFRERNANRSQFETADLVMRGVDIRNCGFSNNRYRSQDQAQSMVAADLLSRARDLAIQAQEETDRGIQALQRCASSPAGADCQRFRDETLPELQREFALMRALRAIGQANPSRCSSQISAVSSPATRPAAIATMFDQGSNGCFAASEISHDVPFLTGLFGSASSPRGMAPLNATERSLVQRMYQERGDEIFSGSGTGWRVLGTRAPGRWREFQEAAQADYERLLQRYPIFNYIDGDQITSENLGGALAQVATNSQNQLRRLRSAPLTEIGTHDGALAQAISELPPEMRGDYCHVVNQFNDDLGARQAGRTFLLVGAGLATMGAGLLPATVVGAATEGAFIATSMAEYGHQSLRCQAGATDGSPGCSPDRLRDARDNLYSPTDGALFLAGGAIDAAGAFRYMMRGQRGTAALAPGAPDTPHLGTEPVPQPASAAAAPGNQRNFAPINEPAVIREQDLLNTSQSDLVTLRELGAGVSESGIPSVLEFNQRHGFSQTQVVGASDNPHRGQVLRIETVPPARSSRAATAPALTHPEMAAYHRRMREMGYELVVDSSMSHLGWGAYFSSSDRVIALRPNSNWSTFLHEFQHLEFHHHILRHERRFESLVMTRQQGYDLVRDLPREAVAEIGRERLVQIQSLIDRGITPRTAVNESLSVMRELEALGWRRYVPNGHGSHTYRYMLRHQITELQRLGDRATPLQRRALEEAMRNYGRSELYDSAGRVAIYGTMGVGAVGTGAGGMALISYLAQENYTEVYYDQRGNLIGRRSDGQLVYIRMAPNP